MGSSGRADNPGSNPGGRTNLLVCAIMGELLLKRYGRYGNVLIMTQPLTQIWVLTYAALEIIEKVVK